MAAAGPIAVDVEQVVKSFGAVRALDGLSLRIETGQVYGLLGPNGAGKTTLLRLLATLGRADAGRIEIAGVDVAADPATARQRLRLVGQAVALDDHLTGRENVVMAARLCGLPARRARRCANQVLDQLGLGEVAMRRAGSYSGGMRRRLDLAAGLVAQPQVLLLDEPTTGVDPASRLALWHQVRELVAQGTTVLLTTQQLEEADRLAARIGVLDHGRLVCQGTPGEVKATLGGDRLEITPTEAGPDPILAALQRLPGARPGLEATTGRVRLAAPNGHQTMLEALRVLDAANVAVADIAVQAPTLDEVFITVTGQPPAQEHPQADHSGREGLP